MDMAKKKSSAKTDTLKTRGARIRLLREKMDITQEVLADKVNTAQSKISTAERSERIAKETVQALANFFQVPLDDIAEVEPDYSPVTKNIRLIVNRIAVSLCQGLIPRTNCKGYVREEWNDPVYTATPLSRIQEKELWDTLTRERWVRRSGKGEYEGTPEIPPEAINFGRLDAVLCNQHFMHISCWLAPPPFEQMARDFGMQGNLEENTDKLRRDFYLKRGGDFFEIRERIGQRFRAMQLAIENNDPDGIVAGALACDLAASQGDKSLSEFIGKTHGTLEGFMRRTDQRRQVAFIKALFLFRQDIDSIYQYFEQRALAPQPISPEEGGQIMANLVKWVFLRPHVVQLAFAMILDLDGKMPVVRAQWEYVGTYLDLPFTHDALRDIFDYFRKQGS